MKIGRKDSLEAVCSSLCTDPSAKCYCAEGVVSRDAAGPCFGLVFHRSRGSPRLAANAACLIRSGPDPTGPRCYTSDPFLTFPAATSRLPH